MDADLRFYSRQIKLCNFGSAITLVIAVEVGSVGLVFGGYYMVFCLVFASLLAAACLRSIIWRRRYEDEMNLAVCRSVLDS